MLGKHAKIRLRFSMCVRHGYCGKPTRKTRRNLDRRADIVPNEEPSPFFRSALCCLRAAVLYQWRLQGPRNFTHLGIVFI